jgi:hypothetical protein
VGKALEQHGHDKDAPISTLVRDAGNLAQILQRVVVGGCPGLEVECGLQKTKSINPGDMLVSGEMSVNNWAAMDSDDERCAVCDMAFDRFERSFLVSLEERLHEQELRAVFEVQKSVLVPKLAQLVHS